MKFELKKDEKGGKRTFALQLSLTRTVVLGLVLLMGMTWVFIFGVLVGRGYRPEQDMPELAKLMPDSKAANVTAQAPPESPRGPAVMEAEELQFPGELKDKPFSQAKSAPAATPPAVPAPRLEPAKAAAASEEAPDHGDVVQASRADRTPEAQSAAPAPLDSEASAPEPSPAPAAKPEPAPPVNKAESSKKPEPVRKEESTQSAKASSLEDEKVYAYVYQAAAFADLQMAERLSKKIEAAGLTARVQTITDASGKNWNRVMVNFTGRPQDTDIMKEKLAQFKVGKAILRSKTPAQ